MTKSDKVTVQWRLFFFKKKELIRLIMILLSPHQIITVLQE